MSLEKDLILNDLKHRNDTMKGRLKMEIKIGYILLHKSSTVRPRHYAGMLFETEEEAKAASLDFKGKPRQDFLGIGKVR